MRHLKPLVLALALVAGPAAGISRASDIRDLLLLKDAGLGDDILIELIQSDGSVFHLKAADIIELHQRGLSDRVLKAMLATARKPAPPTDQVLTPEAEVPEAPVADRARVDLPPQPPAQSDEVTTGANDAPPVASWPTVMVETVVERPQPVRTQVVEVYVPVAVAVPVVVEKRHPAPPPAPVYWGYGGQKRPGSWDEPGVPTQPAKPAPPKGGRGGE